MSVLNDLMTAHANVNTAQTALTEANAALVTAQAAYDEVAPKFALIEQLDAGASLEIHALLDQIKALF